MAIGTVGSGRWEGWMVSLTNAHEFEQTLGDNGGQGSLACCSSWSCRVRCDLVTELQQKQHRGTLLC